jgi:hypothetical protein
MKKNVTDIYLIEKTDSDNVFKCKNPVISKIGNKFKKIGETSYRIYSYNDMFLMINQSDNKKSCESYKYVNKNLNDNVLVIEYITNQKSIYSVPFIGTYNDDFVRYITYYENGICVIRDKYPNETILFIRLENKMELDNILLLLK